MLHARPLGIPAGDKAATVLAEASSWLDPPTPFIHQAGVKGVGADCAQFLRASYMAASVLPLDFGDHLPYPRGYWREGVGTRYRDVFCLPYFDLIWEQSHGDLPAGLAQPGDLALFWTGAAEAHGAIVIDWPRVIHARPGAGVVEERAGHNALAEYGLSSLWRPKGACVGL